MKSTIAAITLGFLVSALLTPVVRRVARRTGAVDEAGGRRVHSGRIPRLGGIGVAIAFFVPLVVLFVLDSSLGKLFFQEPRRIIGLGAGACIVLALGAMDDLRGMSAKAKLAGQSAAGLVAWWGGYDISAVELPWLGIISFGWVSMIVTVVWFVGVINALNLIDGLDGLAAGIAFFACFTNIVVGTMNDSLLAVLLSASLGGALLGFLIYNFNPATIFMGDSGSMFLGFVLAASSVLGTTIKSSTTVAILVPVVALGVPITDTVWAFARRLKSRRSIFSADRGHIHHRLLDIGLSQRNAVVVLYGISLTLALAAGALALGKSLAAGGALIVMTVMIVGVVRTAKSFALRGQPATSLREQHPMVEGLRRQVPLFLRDVADAENVAVVSVVRRFARQCSLGELSMALPDALASYRVQPLAADGSDGSARTVQFSLDDLGSQARLSFTLTDYKGDDQVHILLQLVADAIERRLKEVPEYLAAMSNADARAAFGAEDRLQFDPGSARLIGRT